MQTGRRYRECAILLVVALVATVVVSFGAVAGAVEPPVPTVTGPVTGGAGDPALLRPALPPDSGYVTEEYFISGDATAYTSAQPLTSDGEWAVTTASAAPYTTRMVVVRPSEPKAFNGTVVVEWLNVSAGFDSPAGYLLSHLVMLREGMAWVGVSAQAVGVQGGSTTVGGVPGGGIKAGDPGRYASLSHPGDSYSYDIFTQAGRAIRGDGDVQPLGDLEPKRLIATGESQSATRMVTYIDAVNPIAGVYDAYLVHSRFGGAAALSQAPLPAIPAPVPTLIRTDQREPVLVFLTETDVGPLGAAAARQPDTKRVRTWEVAGTAHADAYTGQISFADTGDGAAELALLDVTKPSRGPLNCDTPVNSGPQYAVLMAAVSHLEQWVRKASPPPTSPRIEVTPGPSSTVGGVSVPSFVITRDADGNAVGGIRTAFVDAPRSALTGEFNSGGTFCRLFGTATPFDAAALSKRYPSRDAFVAAFRKATKQSAKAGFLLPEEAKKQLTAIEQVPYPGA